MAISRTNAIPCWTEDYERGINHLANGMYEGCRENDRIIKLLETIVAAETAYGETLQRVKNLSLPGTAGRGPKPTLNTAVLTAKEALTKQGQTFITIANSNFARALHDFKEFAAEHKQEIGRNVKELTDEIKEFNAVLIRKHGAEEFFNSQREYVNTLRKELQIIQTSQSAPSSAILERPRTQYDTRSAGEFIIGGLPYSKDTVVKILGDMLVNIPRSDYINLFGIKYENTSRGEEIANWIMLRFNIKDIGRARAIGQELIKCGFIQPTGAFGGPAGFECSGEANYQWTRLAFKLNGNLERGLAPVGLLDGIIRRVETIKRANAPVDEATLLKAVTDEKAAEDDYSEAIDYLDQRRCALEDHIDAVMVYMVRLETTRISTAKLALNFSVPQNATGLQPVADVLALLAEASEAIDTSEDIRIFQNSCKTGFYAPKVYTYSNGRVGNSGKQLFGVSLLTRMTDERHYMQAANITKAAGIPSYMNVSLKYLQNRIMQSKEFVAAVDSHAKFEVVVGLWTEDVRLKPVHALRTAINNGYPFIAEDEKTEATRKYNTDSVFAKYDLLVVIGALKLYLIELPESVVEPRFAEKLDLHYKQLKGDAETLAKYEELIVAPLAQILKSICEDHLMVLRSLVIFFLRLFPQDQNDACGTWTKPSGPLKMLARELSGIILRPPQASLQARETFINSSGYFIFLDFFFFYKDIIKAITQQTANSGSGKAEEKSRKQIEQERHQQQIAQGRSLAAQQTAQDAANGQVLKVVLTPSSKRRSASNGSIIIQSEQGSRSASPETAAEAANYSTSIADVHYVEDQHLAPVESGTEPARSMSPVQIGATPPERASEPSSPTVEGLGKRFQGVQLVDPPMDDE
ncbi:uncharacterized protein V1518DRAFT_411146 [Limtongia smithiae]|uniref:uncharacterized protein n=1 Tax=Limtongia smithiae TaxID=1125753 RepID=UPI0034CFBA92